MPPLPDTIRESQIMTQAKRHPALYSLPLKDLMRLCVMIQHSYRGPAYIVQRESVVSMLLSNPVRRRNITVPSEQPRHITCTPSSLLLGRWQGRLTDSS